MVKAPIEWKGDKRLLRCSRSLVIATSTEKSTKKSTKHVWSVQELTRARAVKNKRTGAAVDSDAQVESPSKTVKETKARFRKILDECEKSGEIKRAIKSMPNRLKLLIKAKGGPIKY